MLDEYAERAGVPSRVIVDDEQVAAVRDARAKAQHAQQQAEVANSLAGTASSLAGADTGGKNALTDILGGLSGVPAAA
jgi:hypothetical protein